MKPLLCSLFLTILISSTAQDLSGYWRGGLPQDGKPYVWSMEANLEQRGDSVFGTTKYWNPKGESVEFRTKGIKRKNRISLTEIQVLNYTSGNWCVKNLNGKIQVDDEKGTIRMFGDWYSYKNFRGGTYFNGNCRPGQFEISKEFVSEPLGITLEGTIYDKTNLNGIDGKLLFASADQTLEADATEGGKFKILLNADQKYVLRVESIGYESEVVEFETTSESSTKNFFLLPKKEFETDKKYTLNNVLFQRSKAVLLPESYSELDGLTDYLIKNKQIKIIIEGHTDRTGSSKKNMELSWNRASAIRDYLIKGGISKKRISTQGYGDTQVICEPPCKQNRRVEFILSGSK